MIVARTAAELSALRAGFGADARTVGFVATMGALHAGHQSLFAIAREHAQVLVVSIFVNPLQFGPDEDYAQYPRPLEDDLEVCRASGVDVVFMPSVTELYPPGRQVSLSAGAMGSILEGASRPGHFDGVLTVVAKLFNLVRPTVAVFGEKDAQQLACVRRMVTDLNFGVTIIGAPIVRESDGLAMSSRNRYLSVPERALALHIFAALQTAAGHSRPKPALKAARRMLEAAEGLDVDYLTLVQPVTLADLGPDYTGTALLLVAAKVGTTRLIDNACLTFPAADEPELGLSAVAAV